MNFTSTDPGGEGGLRPERRPSGTAAHNISYRAANRWLQKRRPWVNAAR